MSHFCTFFSFNPCNDSATAHTARERVLQFKKVWNSVLPNRSKYKSWKTSKCWWLRDSAASTVHRNLNDSGSRWAGSSPNDSYWSSILPINRTRSTKRAQQDGGWKGFRERWKIKKKYYTPRFLHTLHIFFADFFTIKNIGREASFSTWYFDQKNANDNAVPVTLRTSLTKAVIITTVQKCLLVIRQMTIIRQE